MNILGKDHNLYEQTYSIDRHIDRDVTRWCPELTAASLRLWKVKDGNRLGFDLLQHIFSNFIRKAPTAQLTVARHRRWKSDGGAQDVAKGTTRMWTSDSLMISKH